MAIIVGLRNPERDYAATRHNVGAEVVESYAAAVGAKFRKGRRGMRAVVAEAKAEGRRVVLALPLTSMNHAGQAVAPLVDYYGDDGEDLLVVHDDIDLPFGRLRVQDGGGAGGHNGVTSVIGSVGRDFWRLKLGVGRPPGSMDPADYVLRRFTRKERPLVDVMVAEAVDVVGVFVTAGPEQARQQAGEMGVR